MFEALEDEVELEAALDELEEALEEEFEEEALNGGDIVGRSKSNLEFSLAIYFCVAIISRNVKS